MSRLAALVRHPIPAIAAGICYGRLDLELAEDVAATVAFVLAALSGLEVVAVSSSPARRCRTVAEPIAAALRVPLHLDPRLLELDFGAWEGLAWDDVPREELDRWARDPAGFAPPGGESGAHLLARVASFAAGLRRERADAVVVSHGGPLRLLAPLLRGEPADLLAAPPAFGAVQLVTVQRLPPAP